MSTTVDNFEDGKEKIMTENLFLNKKSTNENYLVEKNFEISNNVSKNKCFYNFQN